MTSNIEEITNYELKQSIDELKQSISRRFDNLTDQLTRQQRQLYSLEDSLSDLNRTLYSIQGQLRDINSRLERLQYKPPTGTYDYPYA